MRAFLLVSILLALLGAAFVVQKLRYDAPARAAEPPGAADEIVLEIGGGPPPKPAPRRVETPPPARDAAPPRADVAPPSNETPSVPIEPSPSPKAPSPADSPADGLKIAKGDTISHIAKRYYGSASPSVWRDIAKANGLADAAKLKEGAMLTLPPVAGGRPRQK
ncbi:MAG TPA: LysM domain-containing protein [Planctomycetota bacterium]|nr:LysM domain-containing protein [Planctomycetota bacterium]